MRYNIYNLYKKQVNITIIIITTVSSNTTKNLSFYTFNKYLNDIFKMRFMSCGKPS